MSDEQKQDPPAPTPAPQPPASSPGGTGIDPTKWAETLSENASLQKKTREMEKDLASLRKKTEISETLNAKMRAALGLDEDGKEDPKAILEKRDRERQEAEGRRTRRELTLSRHLLTARLAFKDEDPDYPEFVLGKIERDEELAKLLDADPPAAVEKLKEKGYVVAPMTVPAPAPQKGMPQPGRPAPGAAPADQRFAGIKSARQFAGMTQADIEAFSKAEPARYRQLMTDLERGLSRGGTFS